MPLHLDYDDSTLVDRLERSVRVQPDRVALDFLGGTTTYARFADRVARVAEGLRRLGVGPGDCVALVMPNCPQNVVAFYAVLRLGATVVEHNPLYTVGELHLPFVDHAARVAIVWDKVVPVVEQLRAGSALRARRGGRPHRRAAADRSVWRCGCRSRRHAPPATS